MSMREVAGKSHVSIEIIIEWHISLAIWIMLSLSVHLTVLKLFPVLMDWKRIIMEIVIWDGFSFIWSWLYFNLWSRILRLCREIYSAKIYFSWVTNALFYYNHFFKDSLVNLFVSISGETIELVEILNTCKSESPDSVNKSGDDIFKTAGCKLTPILLYCQACRYFYLLLHSKLSLRWSYLHCNVSFVIYIIESIANELKKLWRYLIKKVL